MYYCWVCQHKNGKIDYIILDYSFPSSMLTLKQLCILSITEQFVMEFMRSYDWSHDYHHVSRVKDIATKIAISENLSKNDIFEVQLGALLHDINDSKYKTSIVSQEDIIQKLYEGKMNQTIIDNIINIACNISLSKEMKKPVLRNNDAKCIKLQCVQDADRIESLGAIGIARYMKYGITQKNSELTDIIDNMEWRTNILVERINTPYGKNIAREKYNMIKMFIEDYKKSL